MDLSILGIKIDAQPAVAGGQQAQRAFDDLKKKAAETFDAVDKQAKALGGSLKETGNEAKAMSDGFKNQPVDAIEALRNKIAATKVTTAEAAGEVRKLQAELAKLEAQKANQPLVNAAATQNPGTANGPLPVASYIPREAASSETSDMVAAIQAARSAYEDEAKAAAKVAVESAKVAAPIKTAGAAVKATSADFETLVGRFKDGQAQMQGAWDKMTGSVFNLRNGLLALGVAMVAKEGIQTFGETERALSAVKAVTGATTSEMHALNATVLSLASGGSEFGPAQIARGMKELGQAGFSASQIMAALTPTLRLATAAEVDVGKAAATAKSVMEAFGKDASQAESVMDVMAATANKTATDLGEMGESFKYVAPLARSFKLSVEDVSASLGILANNGIQGSMAGTGLREVLSSLAAPTAAARQALLSMGLTIDDLNPATHSLTEVIQKLALAGLDVNQAITIFGSRGSTVMQALVNQAPQVAKLNAELSKTKGTLSDMSSVMHDNLEGDVKSFSATMQAAAVTTGESGFGGALRSLVQTATQTAAAMFGLSNPLDQANRKGYEMVEVLKLVGAGLAGLAVARASYLFIEFAAGLAKATVAMLGFNAAASANPILLVATVIGGLVAGYIALKSATTEAERAQAKINETLQEANRLKGEGSNASEAAVRATLAEVRSEELLTEAKMHGNLAKIEELKLMLSASRLQDQGTRKPGEPDGQLSQKTLRIQRELMLQQKAYDDNEKAFESTASARATLEQQLSDIIFKAAQTELGVTSSWQDRYDKMVQAIKSHVPDIAQQTAMIEELGRRMNKLQSGKSPNDDVSPEAARTAQLKAYVATLDTAQNRQQRFTILQQDMNDAASRNATGLSKLEAEVQIFYARLASKSAMQNFADGLNTGAAAERAYGEELEKLNLALKSGAIKSAQEYDEALNELNRRFQNAGAIKSFVASLDTAGARTSTLRTQQAQLNEAYKAGKISLEDYNEALRQINDGLEVAGNLTGRSVAQLQELFNADKTTSAQRSRIHDELIRRMERGEASYSQSFKQGLNDQVKDFGNAQERMYELGSRTADALTNDFSTFFEDSISGTESLGQSFKKLISQILKDLARLVEYELIVKPIIAGLTSAMGSFGTSSALNSGVGAVNNGANYNISTVGFTAHTGGIPGVDPLPGRSAPLSTWIGAPRMHTGGIVGAGEQATILKKDEGVFTPGQMKALGGALSRPVQVSIDPSQLQQGGAGGGPVEVNYTQNITITPGANGAMQTESKDNKDNKGNAQLTDSVTRFLKMSTEQTIMNMTRPGGMLWTWIKGQPNY